MTGTLDKANVRNMHRFRRASCIVMAHIQHLSSAHTGRQNPAIVPLDATKFYDDGVASVSNEQTSIFKRTGPGTSIFQPGKLPKRSPYSILRQIMELLGPNNMSITFKTSEEIEKMRVAGRLASEVLDYITPFIKPGVTTGALDKLCHDYMVDVQGCIPAPLDYAPAGYKPYPNPSAPRSITKYVMGFPATDS